MDGRSTPVRFFLDQLEKLALAVERARAKDPGGYASTANAKLLAALRKLMFEVIPVDPARPEFRQGGGHWVRRASTGSGRSSAAAGSGCSSVTAPARRSSSSPG